MKQRFFVDVSYRAMNDMSLYERLRNAVFEWQTTEPGVRSVSVVPAPLKAAEAGEQQATNQVRRMPKS